MSHYDAVVVGSGPNGLAAAITLAQSGQDVLLIEAKDSLGGGMRTAELTLSGFKHDICSAIHPFGIGSPFFSSLPLADYGLRWIHPEATIAHPLDDGVVLSYTSLEKTLEDLGRDKQAYRFLFEPMVNNWDALLVDVTKPLIGIPKHPIALARFGWRALLPATVLANSFFKDEQAKALFAGIAAHSILPLNQLGTSAAGLLLGTLGYVSGWPMPKGGTQSLAKALAAYFEALGGKIETGWHVKTLAELPASNNVFLDLTPKQFLAMTDDLPPRYIAWLERFQYGAGVFKIDYALSEPVPWKDKRCLQAGTVHLGGKLDEVAASEQGLTHGIAPENPFVLAAQQSLFDETRAPKGKHTLWAYCHVPSGFRGDMTDAIEQQIERFAPGFKDCILAKCVISTSEVESYNPNYIGGDINAGSATLWQLVSRPLPYPNPYKTPLKGVYLCSASTPPGGGVHGLCGYNAAKASLKK